MSKDLRSRTIRLAHENPELREHLLPLLKQGEVKGIGLDPHVPAVLAWEHKDGRPLSSEEAAEVSQMNTPALKYKSMSFASKDEALEAAKKIHAKVTQISEV
jgi:hypothetical protein